MATTGRRIRQGYRGNVNKPLPGGPEIARWGSLCRCFRRYAKRQCCNAKYRLQTNDLSPRLCIAAMRSLTALFAFLDVSSLNLAAPQCAAIFLCGPPFGSAACGGTTGIARGECPSGADHPARLGASSVRAPISVVISRWMVSNRGRRSILDSSIYRSRATSI